MILRTPDVDGEIKYPLLSRGSQGPAVKEVQTLLNVVFGPPDVIIVSGTYTELTETLVRRFQSKSIGLPITGKMDAATWEALRNAEASSISPWDVEPVAPLVPLPPPLTPPVQPILVPPPSIPPSIQPPPGFPGPRVVPAPPLTTPPVVAPILETVMVPSIGVIRPRGKPTWPWLLGLGILVGGYFLWRK